MISTELLIIRVGTSSLRFLRPFNDQLLSAAGFSWDRPPLTPVHWSQGRYLLQAIRRKPDFAGYALTEHG